MAESNKGSTQLSPLDSCPYCQGKSLASNYKHWFGYGFFTPQRAVLELSGSSCRACKLTAEALLSVYPEIFSKKDEEWQQFHISKGYHSGEILLQTRPALDTHGALDALEQGIQFFTSADSSIPAPFWNASNRHIAPIAGDPMMWDFLKECLRDCGETHSLCSSDGNSDWSPKRLLALKQNEKATLVRLIDTEETPCHGEYATLSYCWGNRLPLRLMTWNIRQYKKDIQFAALPICFQDAVTTAIKLGVYYLWIDSLCIVQNDESDWVTQLPRMDRIFANACFTIRAVESSASTVPFLGNEAPSTRDRFQGVRLRFGELWPGKPEIFARKLLSGNFEVASSYEGGPLAQRAWAWQERYLSARSVSFYKQAVVWRCKSLAKSECGRTVRILNKKTGFVWTEDEELEHYMPDFPMMEWLLEPGHDGWLLAVQAYSGCKLTYDSDRLPALSGAATRLQGDSDDRYAAGLWANDLPYSLCWTRSSKLCASQPAMSNNCPSWSWASVEEAVDFHIMDNAFSRDNYHVSAHTKVVSIDCQPATPNPYGEVREGSSITLSAQAIEGTLTVDERGNALVRIDSLPLLPVSLDCKVMRYSKTIDGRASCFLARVSARNDANSTRQQSVEGAVFCMKLMSHYGGGCSILVLTRSVEYEDGFQRLGYTGSAVHKHSALDECEEWTDVGSGELWKVSLFDGMQTRSFKIY